MNEQIGLKEAWEQLLSYDPAVWVGVFTAIIVFAIEIILHNKNIIFWVFCLLYISMNGAIIVSRGEGITQTEKNIKK